VQQLNMKVAALSAAPAVFLGVGNFAKRRAHGA